MANEVRLNFLNDVQGMEELVRLINRVDALEKAMDRYKSAAGRASGAINTNAQAMMNQGKAARQAQIGAQQLGLQINDLSTSISTGANPMIAFNQQLGQIGYAMSQMQGRARTLGMFLAGTWGAALGLAAMGLYTLWQNSRDTTESIEDLVENKKEDYRASLQNEKADRAYAMTLEGVTEAIDRNIAALEKLNGKRKTAAERALNEARANMANAAALQIETSQKLIAAQVSVNRALNGPSAAAIAGPDQAALAGGELSRREKALQDLQKSFAQGAENLFKAQDAIDSAMKAVSTEAEEAARRASKSSEKSKKALTDLEIAAKSLIAEYRAGKIAPQEFALALDELRTKLAMSAIETEKPIDALKRYAAQADEAAARMIGLRKEVEAFLKEGSKAIDIKGIDQMLDISDSIETLMDKSRDLVRGYTDEMKSSFDNVGRSVSDAFQGMLTGSMSWRDGLRSIISSVIDQLWQLYVVQTITGFITKGLGALGLPIPIPGRAKGGPIQASQPYVVGEKGPELIIPGRSGTVIPNDKMPGGASGIVINVDARSASDPAEVRRQVQMGIFEAAPQIIAASEARTIRTLRRPRLPGGAG